MIKSSKAAAAILLVTLAFAVSISPAISQPDPNDTKLNVKLDRKRAQGIKKAAKTHRYFATAEAIVVDNQDSEGEGRVKVRFPWLDPDDTTGVWARMSTLMAGPDRGFFWLPEVDDEVLVAFLHGDIRFPVVLGGLYNGVDRPADCNADDSACLCAKPCPGGAP